MGDSGRTCTDHNSTDRGSSPSGCTNRRWPQSSDPERNRGLSISNWCSSSRRMPTSKNGPIYSAVRWTAKRSVRAKRSRSGRLSGPRSSSGGPRCWNSCWARRIDSSRIRSPRGSPAECRLTRSLNVDGPMAQLSRRRKTEHLSKIERRQSVTREEYFSR